MNVNIGENQRLSTKDDERADRIRSHLFDLSKEITEAKASGLIIDLKLCTLGTPQWIGYQDAVVITRKF